MLSWIQKNALLVLLRKPTANVQEMRPEGVEANLFSYHLEGLQSSGYLEKVGRGAYTLTTKGQRFVGAFSTETNKQHEFIKTVIVLYAQSLDGKYLVFRWSRQPYINQVGLLHDHMALGKSLEDGITGAMQDKLGVVVDSKYVANALVKIKRDGELVTHMNALVYKVPIEGLSLPFESRNGTAFLADLTNTENAMDGLQEILEQIEDLTQPAEYILRY